MLFEPIARIHPKFKTPHIAIGLVATMGLIFVLFLRFEKLADTFVIAMIPFYALGVAAVYPLRRRPGYAPSFRTPGYPLVPALFIASVGYLLVNALIDPSSRYWAIGIFAVLLAGVPFYYLTVGQEQR
jgi:amino acid transporter